MSEFAVNEGSREPRDWPNLDGAAQSPNERPADRYQILDEIARGGMGVVFRATDRTLRREIAIKVLQDRFDVDSSTGSRFVREARIAGQLQHPGVPAVHDLGFLPDGRPFLAMRLVDGRTLDEILKDRDGRGPNCIAVFEQICQVIGYAHARGVVHRDLKPSNVMVGAFGEVQVMDWGLAKALGAKDESGPSTSYDDTTAHWSAVDSDQSGSDATRAGSVLGTAAYMPPEQAIGAIDQVDERSDVFGLGAVLCVILTGKPPYVSHDSESTRQLAARAKLDDAMERLDCSLAEPEFVALCKRCLSVEKNDRPADGAAVAAIVASLRSKADERARNAEVQRAKAEAEALEQRKRRRVQAALTATFGLLVVVASAFAWRQLDLARTTRERFLRNSDAVVMHLDQCRESLRAGDFKRAAVALKAADARMAEGGADQHRPDFESANEDLEVLKNLRAVDEFRWASVDFKLPGLKEVARQTHESLRHFGVIVSESDVREAAARIARSSVRERLIASVDFILRVERNAAARAILREVDAEPYREALRDALFAGDRSRLIALVGQKEILEQPAWFSAALTRDKRLPVKTQRQVLTAALQRNPNDYGLLISLGWTFPDDREFDDERLRWFQAALAAAPDNSDAHNSLGITLRGMRDWTASMAAFREAIRLDPTCAVYRCNLAMVLSDAKDFDAAISEIKEALRIDPGYANGHYSLSHALSGKGDFEGALSELHEALRLDPELAEAQSDLGMTLRTKGDLDGAIGRFREAIRLKPNLAPAHNNLGAALHKKRDLDGAVAAFSQAIKLDGKLAMAHVGLGSTLVEKGDLDGAVASFRQGISIDPKVANGRAVLGNALRIKGDVKGALDELAEAVKIDPRSAYAHNYLAWIMGQGPVPLRNGERAVSHGRSACELTAWKNPTYIAVLAAAHAELGDFDKAVELHQRAMQSPTYVKQKGMGAQDRLDQFKMKKPFHDPDLIPRGTKATKKLRILDEQLLDGQGHD